MINISKPIIEQEEKDAVIDVLNSGMLAQGHKVKEFEEAFTNYCGCKYAVAVNSGTAALHCALYALGIKDGDEVITTPFTFVATANPILMQGAKVVFADIDKNTFNLDVAEVEKKITAKTKAIIAVDLFGQTCDYDSFKELAFKYNLKIIGDSCQSHAAEYKGIKTGNIVDITCFSFYATKNMMSGEGGIITTNNADYAELCKRFRHHGQSEQTRYQYFDLGYNYRMTNLHAAIAVVQLAKLDLFTEKRISNAKKLDAGLKNVNGIQIPIRHENGKHVFHQYSILCADNKKRDALISYLRENGVGAGIYYPKPLHLHPHFSNKGYNEGDFPVSEDIAKRILSLPVHPKLSKDDINNIINTIWSFGEKNE